MKKNLSRRHLKLSTETVRALDDAKVSSVQGGGAVASLPAVTCSGCVPTKGCDGGTM